MNRSFSPRSPAFHGRFRMNQQQSPWNPNFPPPMQYNSIQTPPNFSQNNSFDLPSPRNPNFSSPQFHSSPKVYSPRNNSPYRSHNSSLNNSWNNQSNQSSGSTRNSSSYFADISGSPNSYQSPSFQNKKNHSLDDDSNPGHSYNIEDYIDPSMLEDPWKGLMAKYEQSHNESQVSS